jgi:drug/metabolite transporter (DMT)-like permease
MSFPLYLLLPLASAITYTFAAMLFKRILDRGASLWYINFLSNIGSAVLVLPLWFMESRSTGTITLWQPFVASLIFIAGQMFSLLALKAGDVSVATPLLGTKVIAVAFLTVFFLSIPVPLLWWIASFITVLALALLRGQKQKGKDHFFRTVVYSLLCAGCFALCDVLIQKWAPLCGPNTFLTIMFLIVGILSLAFIPLFAKTRLKFSRQDTAWLALSIVFISFQAVAMGVALSRYGNATAINIVFSSRGMWSVLFIWWFGRLLGNDESLLGRRAFWQRLAGSALILIAIVLVMV